MRHFLSSLLVCFLASCSLAPAGFESETAESTNEADEIEIVNKTDRPIAFAVHELESSHLVDPKPKWKPSLFDEKKIMVGNSVSLAFSDVPSYSRGDSVRLFLYAQTHNVNHKLSASLTKVKTVTYEGLKQNDFRIVISQLSTSEASEREDTAASPTSNHSGTGAPRRADADPFAAGHEVEHAAATLRRKAVPTILSVSA
jgi:hypothetical protein